MEVAKPTLPKYRRPKMKIEQAMQVMDQVRRKFVGTGEDHEALRSALATIIEFVKDNKPTIEENALASQIDS